MANSKIPVATVIPLSPMDGRENSNKNRIEIKGYVFITAIVLFVILITAITIPIAIHHWEVRFPNDNWRDFWGGFIGATIGAIVTLVGIIISIEFNKKHSNKAIDASQHQIEKQIEANRQQVELQIEANRQQVERQIEANKEQLERQNEVNHKLFVEQIVASRQLMLEEKQLEVIPFFKVETYDISTEEVFCDLEYDLCEYNESNKITQYAKIEISNISSYPAINMNIKVAKNDDGLSEADSYQHDFFAAKSKIECWLAINYSKENLPVDDIDEEELWHYFKLYIAFNTIHNRLKKQAQRSKIGKECNYEYEMTFIISETINFWKPFLTISPL